MNKDGLADVDANNYTAEGRGIVNLQTRPMNHMPSDAYPGGMLYMFTGGHLMNSPSAAGLQFYSNGEKLHGRSVVDGYGSDGHQFS